MPSKFTSFGYKHGPMPRQPGVLVLDVRDWPGIRNPWRVRGFQERNGLDPDVQHYIATGPGFGPAMQELRDRVRDHDGPVWIGCQGGHHRSVCLVELLSAFFEVEHEHRDINRR